MSWHQRIISLPSMSRGFHLITQNVVEGIPEIKQIEIGLLHVFIQHTSASLTINENADPDVRVDMESSINSIVPEDSGRKVAVLETLQAVSRQRQVILFTQEEAVQSWAQDHLEHPHDQVICLDLENVV